MADVAAPPHRVAVLALHGVYPFELGIPDRVFGSANGRYEVVTCSVDGRPVRSRSDFDIAVAHGPEVLETADTVVIPPCAIGAEGVCDAGRDALRRIRAGTRIVSLCTGSFVLAAAGLLDGRPATTHWYATEDFRRLFPAVRLDPDVLFVDDGDVLTAAGAASGVDLCLHLVRKDHGSEIANRVARVCVVPAWRDGGQAQYIERPVPAPTAASTAPAREWALDHLHLPLALSELAERAQMSGRTFARRFREEVGVSPGRWLIQQRVERARHLLESSDLPVDRIAGEVGFATAASLRQHLQAALGVSPAAYRRTFRARTPPARALSRSPEYPVSRALSGARSGR
ncbi:GlxA family transcriptional regulator [Streptomyces boncukensis]|uniref:Helix-turn-helix domain-containing protein n=1 Tax=Streptomyces boncukensis TaxID=2711219 RepID=A0A6G4X365_9ACTN|nr:helix-turn-helix domain-containing protein [Streptomyces boncukensis]NGO71330.1 helix-turn-helix domain-containing protein [Streptomyces boncukensis]